jgi:hypothetical protein
MEAPAALVVAPDSLANLVARTQSKPEHWVATIDGGDQVRVFGYFLGRPSPDLLMDLFDDVASGKTKPLIGYGVKGKSVTISMPSPQ